MKARKIAILFILLVVGLLFQGAEKRPIGAMSLKSGQEDLIPVKVQKLIIDPRSKQPVVILSDLNEERALLIWIGPFEANAIHSELQGIHHNRPLTHDLLEKFIRKTDIKIDRVTITHIEDSTFFAKIRILRGDTSMDLDARPSDSIVLALKLKVPIFATKDLFRDAAIPLTEEKEIEERYGLTLQELTPSLAKAFSYTSTRGVLISDVLRGSRSEKDGVLRGDIFVEIEGRPVENIDSMRILLGRIKAPSQVKIFRRADFLSITLHPPATPD